MKSEEKNTSPKFRKKVEQCPPRKVANITYNNLTADDEI